MFFRVGPTPTTPPPIFSLLGIQTDMAALTLTTYGLRGFNQGKVLLPELCKFSDIILIQEHWLYEDELHVLDEVDVGFCP